MTKFQKCIKQVIAPNGLLKKIGGRYQEEQAIYIQAVADFLEDNNDNLEVGLIEAATGIGKGLGYLTPCAIWLACNPKKAPIAFSTHTRVLQNQLYTKDIVIVGKIMAELGLEMPSCAYRMGKQAFFSPSRVSAYIHQNDPTGSNKELAEFEKVVVNLSMFGTGLWQDYLDMYERFPTGVTSDDVCLTEYTEIDNQGYVRHLENAKTARLLITNHASIVSRYVFNDIAFSAIVADESHDIYSVCESISSHRLQLNKVISTLVQTGIQGKTVDSAVNLARNIDADIRKLDSNVLKNQSVITDVTNPLAIKSVENQIAELSLACGKVKALFAKRMDKQAISGEQANVLAAFEDICTTLEQFVNGSEFNKRGIGFSRVRRIPSLASIGVHPGRLFAYRCHNLTKKVFLTSATIADINQKNVSFNNLLFQLGFGGLSPKVALKLSPEQYGTMQFVVCEDNVAKPIENYLESANLNEQWVNNTASMVDAAAKDGLTLVLTVSFDETKHLGEVLKYRYGYTDDVLVHNPNQKLNEVLSIFTKGKHKFLITPSAWAGVNLRNAKGGQLIKNLVVTRVPYKPMSEEIEQILLDALVTQGKPVAQAKRILFVSTQEQAVNKLKQGIGRGCRSPSDNITVWFCDSRISLIKAHERTGLIHAIPVRFWDNFFNAKVFSANKHQQIAKRSKKAVYL